HVSSGTYCRALAQFDRRRMSQIDFTNVESERVPAMALGGFEVRSFMGLVMDTVLPARRVSEGHHLTNPTRQRGAPSHNPDASARGTVSQTRRVSEGHRPDVGVCLADASGL